jgi:hypothetical protein
MIQEARRLLIDKWYDWAEIHFDRKFASGERLTIVDASETIPDFPHLATSQEELYQLKVKFDEMVKGVAK